MTSIDERVSDILDADTTAHPKPPESYKLWLECLLFEKYMGLHGAAESYRDKGLPTWLTSHLAGYKAACAELDELRSKAKKWDDHLKCLQVCEEFASTVKTKP